MKPSQLAQSLKRIASEIEASKKPNKELVIRDLKNVISSMNRKANETTIYFEMPSDQDWELDFWNRIGEDPGFEQLASAFQAIGAEVDDSEGVAITFEQSKESSVRKLIDDARKGVYGDDVQTYWEAAVEQTEEQSSYGIDEAWLKEYEEYENSPEMVKSREDFVKNIP